MKPWGTAVSFNDKKITIRKLTKQKKDDGVSMMEIKKLGFSKEKIEQFEKTGTLHYFFIGKTKYYNRQDVIKLM